MVTRRSEPLFEREVNDMTELQEAVEDGQEKTGLGLESLILLGNGSPFAFVNRKGGGVYKMGDNEVYPIVKATKRCITNKHGTKFKVNEWPVTVTFHEMVEGD